jgi:Lar family restriction alleviation protein
VLLHIADRLEAHELAMDGMMNSINAQEGLLRDMGGKLADVERQNQILTVSNRELLARCDLLTPSVPSLNAAGLKSCPYCGGDEAEFYRLPHFEKNSPETAIVIFGVYCPGCGADTRGTIGSRTKEAAAVRWNRRVD